MNPACSSVVSRRGSRSTFCSQVMSLYCAGSHWPIQSMAGGGGGNGQFSDTFDMKGRATNFPPRKKVENLSRIDIFWRRRKYNPLLREVGFKRILDARYDSVRGNADGDVAAAAAMACGPGSVLGSAVTRPSPEPGWRSRPCPETARARH